MTHQIIKSGSTIISKFKGGLSRTLGRCFPEVGIGDKRQRRKILEDFAREQGFDSLNPKNWYAARDYISDIKVFLPSPLPHLSLISPQYIP